MRILLLGINYAPELVGIGPYTSQLAAHLAAKGHSVSVITSKPYYPEWRKRPGYGRLGYHRSEEQGVTIWRCPIYVPANPGGVRRILHHVSFAALALPPMAVEVFRRRPALVMAIAPSLIAAPVALFGGLIARARTWLHVQDFEVAAAAATGLLGGSALMRVAQRFEAFVMRRFTHHSSISPQMCDRLRRITGRRGHVVEFRNWTDVDEITPATAPSPLAATLGIHTPYVALYSGNLANKQGIDIIADAARALRDRTDLTFLVCGDGSGKQQFMEAVRDLPNVKVLPLQPRDRLQDLLALATVHLLPQLKGAADLVLPSKLTNMLASGRPVIATADAGTGLAQEVQGCGLITRPGDAEALAGAVTTLIDNPALRESYGRAARVRAEERWSKQSILERVTGELERVVLDARPKGRVLA